MIDGAKVIKKRLSFVAVPSNAKNTVINAKRAILLEIMQEDMGDTVFYGRDL
jgi:hypothetical protein